MPLIFSIALRVVAMLLVAPTAVAAVAAAAALVAAAAAFLAIPCISGATSGAA